MSDFTPNHPILKTWLNRDLTSPPNCPRCQALFGQTVQLYEYFTEPNGTLILGPPLHPGCDCILEYTNPTPLPRRR